MGFDLAKYNLAKEIINGGEVILENNWRVGEGNMIWDWKMGKTYQVKNWKPAAKIFLQKKSIKSWECFAGLFLLLSAQSPLRKQNTARNICHKS